MTFEKESIKEVKETPTVTAVTHGFIPQSDEYL
jgi:hypothetical protein